LIFFKLFSIDCVLFLGFMLMTQNQSLTKPRSFTTVWSACKLKM